ncbi:MAG TPA: pilus assembly protein TadG-related protein [Acidimicrobiia bacterium]|nr:pilus assembly protein TadG-related protein [Acidimicrobiia bacterium]
MLRRLDRRRSDESGAVLVLTVLAMTVMLGFAALVVDIGYTRMKSRQIQNSADAAALGAAQDLPVANAAVETAKSLAVTNLPDGAFPWSTCTDTNKLPATTSTQCISFDSSYTNVRVHIPEQSYPTFFGRVLDRNTLTAAASAEARTVGVGFGSIEPFGLYHGFNAGVTCLKTGPSGHRTSPVCSGPVTGNFNMLDIRQYGNPTLQTVARCGNAQQSERLQNNIALGADHIFRVWTDAPDVVDECGNPGPNTLEVRTGDFQSAFDDGMVHASTLDDGGPARLRRGSYPKATVAGVALDNKPLWEFIPAETLAGIPAACQRATFDGLLAATPAAERKAAMRTALESCFDAYISSGSTAPLFTANTDPFGPESPIDLYDLQLTPRFAYVPQFLEVNPPAGASEMVHIEGFRAVFLQQLQSGCNASSCDVDFEPGSWNTAPQGGLNHKAESISVFVFADWMLPAGLATNPNAVGKNRYVQLVR